MNNMKKQLNASQLCEAILPAELDIRRVLETKLFKLYLKVMVKRLEESDY